MLSAEEKRKIERDVERFNAIYGENAMFAPNGPRTFKIFREYLSQGRCLMVSTHPHRAGMIALKVSIHQAVKFKVT